MPTDRKFSVQQARRPQLSGELTIVECRAVELLAQLKIYCTIFQCTINVVDRKDQSAEMAKSLLQCTTATFEISTFFKHKQAWIFKLNLLTGLILTKHCTMCLYEEAYKSIHINLYNLLTDLEGIVA